MATNAGRRAGLRVVCFDAAGTERPPAARRARGDERRRRRRRARTRSCSACPTAASLWPSPTTSWPRPTGGRDGHRPVDGRARPRPRRPRPAGSGRGRHLRRRARLGRRGRSAGRHDLADVRRARRVLDAHRTMLEAFAGNVFHVGDEPGQGQAMKLLNNFLSATALAATSEALAFGEANGLDTARRCSTCSTCRPGATPRRSTSSRTGCSPAPTTPASTPRSMAKDVRSSSTRSPAPARPPIVGAVVDDAGRPPTPPMPGSDFTEIWPFVSGLGQSERR